MSQNKVIIIIRAIPAENAGIIWYEIDFMSGESGSGFYGFHYKFFIMSVPNLISLRNCENYPEACRPKIGEWKLLRIQRRLALSSVEKREESETYLIGS